MTKEALKLALEALEDLGMKHFENTGEVLYKETFTAIKEALANEALKKKAENARQLGLDYYIQCCTDQTCPKCKATTPPQRTWVGLTPQERDEINEQVYGAVPHHVAFHAAIEAKLRSKNNV